MCIADEADDLAWINVSSCFALIVRALVDRLLIADLDLDVAVLAKCLLPLRVILVVAHLRVRHFHRHFLAHVVIMV